MARRMYRYTVPADGQPHPLRLSHSPVAVAAVAGGAAVEFWAESTESTDGAPLVERWFQVFGTGQTLGASARWVGTCPRTALGLVWHLYEVAPAPA